MRLFLSLVLVLLMQGQVLAETSISPISPASGPAAPAVPSVPSPPNQASSTAAPPFPIAQPNNIVASVSSTPQPLPVVPLQASGAAGPASETAAPLPTMPAPPEASVGALQKKPEKDGKITINFVNTDLRDIFTSIAEQSGSNILVGSDVSGNLSIALREVTLATAIDAIIKAAGLKFTMVNNVYVVNKSGLPFVEELPVPDKPSPIVSLNVRDADLGRVVNNLANQAGVDLVMFGTISDKITARLTKVPFNDALRIILSGTRYTFRITEDGKYVFGDPSALPPTSSALVSNEVVYLNYIKSKDFISLLPPNIPAGNLKAVDDQNALVITGPDEFRGMVKKMVASLDKPAQQVVMDTLVVELSESSALNINYALGDATHQTQNGNVSVNFPNFTATVDSTSNLSSLFAQIKLLISNGQGKVKANPRISTYNGRDANINVVRDFTFKVTTSTPAGLVTQVQTVQAGTSLKVIPYIGAAGEVLTEIHAEVSSVVEVTADGIPQISRRKADTYLRVKDGETIVIGGLIQDNNLKNVEKLPLLGDLPIIGSIFQNRTSSDSQSELIIFITPHLVKSQAVTFKEAPPEKVEEKKAEVSNDKK